MFLVLAATLVSTLLFSQENRKDFSRQMWLTPSVQYHWLRRPSFTAYSGLGYVLSLKDLLSRNNDWYIGFQYTPIGITFGRSLFGLAELGFGPRYFPLRLGLGYRF